MSGREAWLISRYTDVLAVLKAFTPRLVEQLRQRIQTLGDELFDRAPARGEMDLVADYPLPIPATIIVHLLGIPASGVFFRGVEQLPVRVRAGSRAQAGTRFRRI